MKTIVAAGHICLDITPVFPAERSSGQLSGLLVPGRLLCMDGVNIHTGGSVANTGLALKLLGNDVRLLGKVGDDAFGRILQSILAEYGAGGLLVDPDSTTSYTIVLAVPGTDRVFLHHPGANDTFVSADIPDAALEDAALFHFGYPPVMRRMYEDHGKELTDIFRRAREHGLATSLDLCAVDPDSAAAGADWERILRNVLPFVDFFAPSFGELCYMLDRARYHRLAGKGRDLTEGLDLEEEAAPLAERLIELGCGVALIKCGTSGMLYQTAGRSRLAAIGDLSLQDSGVWENRCGIQPCFQSGTVRSGTGAGDTSIAAFLTAVLAGKTPAQCAALAAAEGACCVTEYDALSGLKPLHELEARIRDGWPL